MTQGWDGDRESDLGLSTLGPTRPTVEWTRVEERGNGSHLHQVDREILDPHVSFFFMKLKLL